MFANLSNGGPMNLRRGHAPADDKKTNGFVGLLKKIQSIISKHPGMLLIALGAIFVGVLLGFLVDAIGGSDEDAVANEDLTGTVHALPGLPKTAGSIDPKTTVKFKGLSIDIPQDWTEFSPNGVPEGWVGIGYQGGTDSAGVGINSSVVLNLKEGADAWNGSWATRSGKSFNLSLATAKHSVVHYTPSKFAGVNITRAEIRLLDERDRLFSVTMILPEGVTGENIALAISGSVELG